MHPPASNSSNLIEQALALAQADPNRAIEIASVALGEEISPSDRGRALWALGLARRELDDLEGAATALEEAAGIAEEHRLPALAAEITSSLALVVARTGDSQTALELTDRAAANLEGGAAARNEMQRALILQRLGQHREALASYGVALQGLEDSGDLLAAARLRLNRSVLHVYSGALEDAVADLEHAYRIALKEGQTLLRATSAHNLGFTEGRRGDIPSALAWFEIAHELYSELGGRRRDATLRSDRAEVLAQAGLFQDALADAQAAVSELRGEQEPPALADALLTLARMAVLAGAEEQAEVWADEARRLFAGQDRKTWELQARYVEAVSALRTSGDEQLIGHTLEIVSLLDVEGWESEGRRARIDAARIAFDLGNSQATVRILEPIEDVPPASPLDEVAYAEARYMLARACDDQTQARRSVRRGLQILDRYRANHGSPEVRAGMAHHGVRLVNAAVEDALSEGDAWRVFQAVDTWRARSFDFPPVLPPEDADLAHALTELRSIESDLRETMTAGLLEQRRRAEERVQRITRRVEAGTDGESVTRLDRGELGNALDDRAVVSYFTHRGMVHAVWFDGPHHEVAELGVEARVADEVHSLRFALYRLLATQASPASLDAAERSLKTSAETLSSLLVEPLRMSDSPLVIIPTGVLHRLPWGVLPGIDSRPVSVSPSFRAWMRASRLDRTPGRAALVAGPDLEGARNEVERLARLYPSAQRLTGRNAKVDRVLGLLDGAFVAHLAAHGTFRADNPLFSSLRMADGPLTVYDLERLRSVPSVVVMPSCESGLSDVGVVDDLLGLAAALLRLGTSSLIAPVVPIPDTATLPLMMSVHRRMRQGSPPAAALSEAVTADDGDSPPERAVRAAFVSLGA